MSDLVDPNGEVQMYHSYEPDGQTTLRFRGYIKNPYRYNAERVDYVPGIADFQYLRARYYAPNLGRFIQQDIVWGTITTPLSQNLFIYCQNNPINFTDPSGRIPKKFSDRYEKTKDKYNSNLSRINALEATGASIRPYIQSELDRLYSANVELSHQMDVMMGKNYTYTSDKINNAEDISKRSECWFIDSTNNLSYAPQIKVALDKLYSQFEKDYANSSGKYRDDIPSFMETIQTILNSLNGESVGQLPDGLKMHIMIDDSPNDDAMRFVLPIFESIPCIGDILALTRLVEDETTTSDDWESYMLGVGLRGAGKIAGVLNNEGIRGLLENIGIAQTAIDVKDELLNDSDYMIQVNVWMQVGNSEMINDQYSYNYNIGIYPNKNNATFIQGNGYSGSLLNGDYPAFIGDGTWMEE